MSTPTAYYNEIDGAAAHVLECLIKDGIIANGVVDRRSVRDVSPGDIDGFTQCHFFAGGGLWSVAARLAGWPDDRELWTGSCPCQPFSVAGKGAGTDDIRHLWPDFFRLIRARRPAVVMGEQVAGKAGRDWFHGVRTDLEGATYAGRAVDVPALAVDAPHIRNRLYWVAVANASRQPAREPQSDPTAIAREVARADAGRIGRIDGAGTLADADESGRGRRSFEPVRQSVARTAAEGDDQGGMVNAAGARRVPAAHGGICGEAQSQRPRHVELERPDQLRRNGSNWAGSELIQCHDGKARRTKPGLRLLVDGLPGRVDLWRIAGNAISPILGAEVIKAFLETEGLSP